MNAVPLRTVPADATRPGATAPGHTLDTVLAVLTHTPGEVRLVPPGPLPEGAVVLGHVVAVPGRQLAAVPDGGASRRGPGPRSTPDPELAPGSGLVVDVPGRRVLVDGRERALTRREFELLAYLVQHPGRVLTRAQLLAAVWEEALPEQAPARTVDVHVSRVRRKLGHHGERLQSLRGVGYRWSGRTEDDS